ncbi:serine/threonine-protein kinase [Lyngbya sp. PCC 8106]|uniref:serine/threonine-protein kinase n=1 Tax=Lyngbya sp. (strain PCC 8106) TaxID=313612 RepID=UPI000586AA86|nr:serine/threonine-protein kinase [Lyngbya sp. PCC 8106]
MSTSIYPGQILRNHYHIMRQLGHGGFGRTYLAEDQHRFNELCVLKEFAPQVQGSYGLQKSQELFEREAQILYQLQHPQIPCFRELFREKINGKGYLFVVQDYVKGLTYRELITQYKSQGTRFSELEVTQLMLQLLPVLEYIHSHGVVHRDISPDNVIRRQTDGLPVLIDFGGVKQIKAKVDSELGVRHLPPTPATRLGKVGYAPEEQMQIGIVSPHSDLYSLAATVVVLLTGKEPQHLIDSYHLTWNWRSQTSVSPKLAAILDKMLAHKPGERYSHASQVLQALNDTPVLPSIPTQAPPEMEIRSSPVLTQPPSVEAQIPIPIAATPNTTLQKTSYPKLKFPGNLSSTWTTVLLVTISMVLMGGVGWIGGFYFVNHLSRSNDGGFSAMGELQRQEFIQNRRQELGVDYQYFIELVNEEFYNRYPSQNGRMLTQDPADASWRKRWDKTAYDVLNRLTVISDESRSQLGQYSADNIKTWAKEVNALNLSSRALEDLADARFFYLFPEQPRGENLIDLPIGQIWQALTADELKMLQQGQNLKEVQFDENASKKVLQGVLQPGEGKAYVAWLKRQQNLRIKLEVPQKSTFLSLYTPSRRKNAKIILEDARLQSWSGQLEDTGYYEIIVVSDAKDPINYQLILEVE